jgi:hypothetical protein
VERSSEHLLFVQEASMMSYEQLLDPAFIQKTMQFYDGWMGVEGHRYLREHIADLKYLFGIFAKNIYHITTNTADLNQLMDGDYRSAIAEIIRLEDSIMNDPANDLYALYVNAV